MPKSTPVLLIVNKEDQTHKDILQQVKSQPLHCLQVHSAAECLKAILEKRIALVIVDENLPDLSGLTLVSLLKKMKPELEIIFTTSCHDPQKEIDARLAGILYYAVQPFDSTLLGQIIDRTIAKQTKKALLCSSS